MSEVLKQKHLETNHESHPGAAEVFATADELERSTREAVEQGIILTRLHNNHEDDYPDIRYTFSLEAQDLSSDYHNQAKHTYLSGTIDELPITDEELIMKRTAYLAEERLVERGFHDNNWHLGEPLVESEIEANTPLIQRFELVTGEVKPIEVLNFSDTSLTMEQQEQVREVVSRVTALAGQKVFDATNAIIFKKSDKFRDKVVGTARGMSGVIVLNESLINGTIDKDFVKQLHAIGVDPLEGVLTHELAHLVEQQDTVNNAYAGATGWKEVSTETVDDYGEVVALNQKKLDMPWEITHIDESGDKKTVPAKDIYNLEEIINAKPVSKYGYTNEREDLAEAFIPYTHARHDTSQLDSLRRDAIDGIMQRIHAGEHGPHHVTIREKDLASKIGTSIRPRVYTMAEPVFTYSPPTPKHTRPKFTLDEQQKQAYNQRMSEIVDDYGNTVKASRRSVSRW